MILLAGIAEESPLALVTEALEAMGAEHRVFDQRRVAAANLTLEIADATRGGAIGGTLTFDDESIRSERDQRDLSAARWMIGFLPGIAGLAAAIRRRASTAAASTSSCCDSPISRRGAC